MVLVVIWIYAFFTTGLCGRRCRCLSRSETTQGLQCSSFLVMTYFLLRDYNLLPKKELHSSPWVLPTSYEGVAKKNQRPLNFGVAIWVIDGGFQQSGPQREPQNSGAFSMYVLIRTHQKWIPNYRNCQIHHPECSHGGHRTRM